MGKTMFMVAALSTLISLAYGADFALVEQQEPTACIVLVGKAGRAERHAATELGLAARALRVSVRNLAAMPLPAIVHWEGNHWIVLYDVGKSHVRVADPASGRRKIPRSEFEKKWTGYTALFDYTTEFEKMFSYMFLNTIITATSYKTKKNSYGKGQDFNFHNK